MKCGLRDLVSLRLLAALAVAWVIACVGVQTAAAQPPTDYNTPPEAIATIVVGGEDYGQTAAVPCDGPNGTSITLDGSASSDSDGDGLEYEWSVAEGSGVVLQNADRSVASGVFPDGVHEVTLTVYDLDANGERRGGVGVTSVLIAVVDYIPPMAMVTTDLAALLPANNKMIPVAITVLVSDLCTIPDHLRPRCFVSSNQADDSDGSGERLGDVDGIDGFTAPVEIRLFPDGEGIYRGLVFLRAERDGSDSRGRTYSINVTVRDSFYNLGEASSTVVVPHDRRATR